MVNDNNNFLRHKAQFVDRLIIQGTISHFITVHEFRRSGFMVSKGENKNNFER